jgi:hypothetical protein
MAFDVTKPTMANNINVDIPALLANMVAIDVSLQADGYLELGSARVYCADYNGDFATLPVPAATRDEGSIVIDIDANYGGQAYYNNGGTWKPLCGNRYYRKAAAGANACASASAWTKWDADLDVAPYLSTAASGWAYEITYCLNVQVSAQTTLEVRVIDVDTPAVLDSFELLIPIGTAVGEAMDYQRIINRTFYYEHTVLEQRNIEIQLYTIVGTHVDRIASTGAGTTTPTDYIIIKEIPKSL